MKKRTVLTSALLSLLLICSTVGCGVRGKDPAKPTTEPTPEATPKPVITADQADVLTNTWVTAEIKFTSTKKYKISGDKPETIYQPIDVVFTNRETGRQMTVPAFWYETRKMTDNDFMVRFAPPEYGIWDYQVFAKMIRN